MAKAAYAIQADEKIYRNCDVTEHMNFNSLDGPAYHQKPDDKMCKQNPFPLKIFWNDSVCVYHVTQETVKQLTEAEAS